MRIDSSHRLTLYSYWRSSAAYRVRIALNLKGLAYETIPVHLVRQGGEQLGESFRNLNPQGLVPVLLHDGHVLTQSLSICEYLDECFDHYPLLPVDPVERALVRSLALQIACEIHPVNNLRVQKRLKTICDHEIDTVDWMLHWMKEGFAALERKISDREQGFQGYDVSRPGLFECFLVPQVYNAQRYGMELTAFPTLCRIVTQCTKLTSFIDAAPENQPDATLD